MRVPTNNFGLGLYSIPQASRLLRMPSAKLRRWLKEDYSVVARKVDNDTLTFLELMELHFIKIFRDEGVSLQTVRRAAKMAEKRFQTDYPFAVKQFDTNGKTIFATLIKESSNTKDQLLVEDLAKGQYVFEQIARPFFRKLEYDRTHDQLALRFWPLEQKGRIVLDPDRHFGQPIDHVTGVPTATIFDAVSAGEEPLTVARWLEIPIEAVHRAIQFEKSLVS